MRCYSDGGMPLTVRVSRDDGGATVRVQPSGSLDSATAGVLERELAPILGSAAKVLVLDFAEVTFVSSAGIRVVLAARKQLADRGGHTHSNAKHVGDVHRRADAL